MVVDFCREFMDLTEAEAREAVMSIIKPKKITCFQKLKDCFRMKVYTEWQTTDDSGKEVTHTICDKIELCDPWENGADAIDWDCVDGKDIYKLKQYCFAKGICPLAKDNPYLKRAES